MISKALLERILAQYSLPWDGTHGVTHWARVLTIGRRLAAGDTLALPVVELFAVFHDACRINEHIDHQHGLRGAELAAQWRGECFDLSDDDFSRLYDACSYHTDGQMSDDPIIQVCWDSDRLDLGRVRITPLRSRLSMAAGMDDIYNWADERSQKRLFPEDIREEWGF